MSIQVEGLSVLHVHVSRQTIPTAGSHPECTHVKINGVTKAETPIAWLSGKAAVHAMGLSTCTCLSPGGVQEEGLSILSSLSSGTPRGVPEEGLFVCRHNYTPTFTLSFLCSDFHFINYYFGSVS